MQIAHAARRLAPALIVALLSLSGLVSAVAQPLKVRVGHVPVVGAASFFVLDSAGWAREAGIEITATTFASGTIDMLTIGVAPIAVAHSRSIDVKVVAASSTGESAFVKVPPTDGLFDTSVFDRAVRSGARRP